MTSRAFVAWFSLGSLLASLAGAVSCSSFGADGEPVSPDADGGGGGDGGPGMTDGSPAADAPSDEAGGCSANLATDPKNCGACGHDCQGATCSNMLCEKTNVRPMASTPEMSVDFSRIVWTDFQQVFTCATPDCTGKRGSAMPQGVPVRIVSTNSRLFWSEVDKLGFLSIAGSGTLSGSSAANGETGIFGMAARNESLLFAENDKVKVAGDVVGDVATLTGKTFKHVAVGTGGAVYVADDQDVLYAFDWDGTTVGAGIAPAAITVDGTANSITAIVAGAGTVFWASQGGIGRTTRAGKVSAVIVPNIKPLRIALDTTHVYATLPDGSVMRYDRDGKNPLRLASADGPVSIGVDNSYVYFADKGGIWHVAK